jgi:hypothetical protein
MPHTSGESQVAAGESDNDAPDGDVSMQVAQAFSLEANAKPASCDIRNTDTVGPVSQIIDNGGTLTFRRADGSKQTFDDIRQANARWDKCAGNYELQMLMNSGKVLSMRLSADHKMQTEPTPIAEFTIGKLHKENK